MIRRATNIIMLHEAAHLHGKFHLIISNVIQYELKNYTRSQDTDVLSVRPTKELINN